MINKDTIKHVARDLGIATNAERVILFGSHARGNATEDSDVDLMIIAKSDLPRFKRAENYTSFLGPTPLPWILLFILLKKLKKGGKQTYPLYQPF